MLLGVLVCLGCLVDFGLGVDMPACCPPGYTCTSCTKKTLCLSGTFNLGGAAACTAWGTCASGTYQTNTPTNTVDRACTAWTTCPQGTYQTNTPTNTIDRTCTAWTTCPQGTYQTNTPTNTTNRQCSQCSTGTCMDGYYRPACSATTDTACTVCPTCTSGKYNSGCGGSSNGTCTSCTVCASSGLSTVETCAGTHDAVCGNSLCSQGTDCGDLYCVYGVENSCPSNTVEWSNRPSTFFAGDAWLCKKSSNQGTCQPCPLGWSTAEDSASCVQCSAGQSCDWLGRPVGGLGGCGANLYPTYDASTGETRCKKCGDLLTTEAEIHAQVTRGGIYSSNTTEALAACNVYFTCNSGYVAVQVGAKLTCLPCTDMPDRVPVTHGLTQGDVYSCLYAKPTANTSKNNAGFWGAYATKCRQGYTSQVGAALTSDDCFPCPLQPDVNLGNVALSSPVCAIECKAPYIMVGMACISHVFCTGCQTGKGYQYQITSTNAKLYSAQRLPWNSAGAMRDTTVEFPLQSAIYSLPSIPGQSIVGGQDSSQLLVTPNNMYSLDWSHPAWLVSPLCTAPEAVCTNVQDSVLFATGCTLTGASTSHTVYMAQTWGEYTYVLLERAFGTNNRWVMWRVKSGAVNARWRLPGKVLSMTYSVISGAPYLFLTFVDASFVAFVPTKTDSCGTVRCSANVHSVSVNGITLCSEVQILAGSDSPGQADGPRDIAQFERELSVAVASADPKRVFVADTQNCRLAEIWIDTPGSWLTQVGTIVAACWNEGATPFPRMLTAVAQGSMLLFVTDQGIAQMDPYLRDVVLVVPQDEVAIDFEWIGANETSIRLWSRTQVQIITLIETPCPTHMISQVGGGCTECGTHQYAKLGQCLDCTVPTCPNGFRAVSCSDNADAHCESCPEIPDYPHRNGTGCNFQAVGPCAIGKYATRDGDDCTQCPDAAWGSTLSSGTKTRAGCMCTHGGTLQSDDTCLVPSPYSNAVVGASDPLSTPPEWLNSLGCTTQNPKGKCTVSCPCSDGESFCGATGLYLQQVQPRKCLPCPQGTWGANGLFCTQCKGLRDATAQADACICRAPALWVPPDSCACPAGHYLESAQAGCVQCPKSSIRQGLLVLSDTLDQQGDSLTCDECPPGFTSDEYHTSCVPCPTGWYRGAGQPACMQCADPQQYARDSTSAASCATCDSTCAPGYKATPCPINHKAFECQLCPQLAPGQTWVEDASNVNCYWSCPPDQYIGPDGCNPCTPLQCPPGFTLTPCSSYADANCDQTCTNATMPLENAHFSEGCAWACDEGFVDVTSTYTGWMEYSCQRRLGITFDG